MQIIGAVKETETRGILQEKEYILLWSRVLNLIVFQYFIITLHILIILNLTNNSHVFYKSNEISN